MSPKKQSHSRFPVKPPYNQRLKSEHPPCPLTSAFSDFLPGDWLQCQQWMIRVSPPCYQHSSEENKISVIYETVRGKKSDKILWIQLILTKIPNTLYKPNNFKHFLLYSNVIQDSILRSKLKQWSFHTGLMRKHSRITLLVRKGEHILHCKHTEEEEVSAWGFHHLKPSLACELWLRVFKLACVSFILSTQACRLGLAVTLNCLQCVINRWSARQPAVHLWPNVSTLQIPMTLHRTSRLIYSSAT